MDNYDYSTSLSNIFANINKKTKKMNNIKGQTDKRKAEKIINDICLRKENEKKKKSKEINKKNTKTHNNPKNTVNVNTNYATNIDSSKMNEIFNLLK